MISARSRGFSGSSIGCVVNQKCSRTYSDGGRFTCGVSSRMRSPMLVHAPAERRHPGEAALDQHDLQAGEALEHAFEHQADDGRLHVAAHRVVFLHVVGRPARAGRGVAAAVALHMQADRPACALGRRIDRPVAPMAERIARARRQQDLHEGRIAGALLDLLHGEGRVLLRHHDAGAQPRLRSAPRRASASRSPHARARAAKSRLRSSMPARLSGISMPISTPFCVEMLARASGRGRCRAVPARETHPRACRRPSCADRAAGR